MCCVNYIIKLIKYLKIYKKEKKRYKRKTFEANIN